MPFVKYRNNAQSFQAYTPKALEVPYQAIPFSQVEYSDFTWSSQTSSFTAVNLGVYEVDATAGNIDITLPQANDITYIVFKRDADDDSTNTVRLVAPDTTNKFLRPSVSGSVENKDIITNRPFYVAKYSDNIYEVIYLNDENYPYDRNNTSTPNFI